MSTSTQRQTRRPASRWTTSIVLWTVAITLGVLLWPTGLIVAGLLVAITALVGRTLPRALRIALLIVGLLTFGVSLVGYLDFTLGHVVMK